MAEAGTEVCDDANSEPWTTHWLNPASIKKMSIQICPIRPESPMGTL